MPFHVPLHIKEIFWVGVGGVFIVRVFRQIVFLREKRTDTPQHIDTLAAVHDRQFVLGHQLFATLSSDEFKKTAAAKKNLCGCRSNWRLEAKKSPVVPGK